MILVSYQSWPLQPGTSWAPWWESHQTGWRAGSGSWWTETASARCPWRPPCWPAPPAGGVPTTGPRPGPLLIQRALRCCFLTGGATTHLEGTRERQGLMERPRGCYRLMWSDAMNKWMNWTTHKNTKRKSRTRKQKISHQGSLQKK